MTVCAVVFALCNVEGKSINSDLERTGKLIGKSLDEAQYANFLLDGSAPDSNVYWGLPDNLPRVKVPTAAAPLVRLIGVGPLGLSLLADRVADTTATHLRLAADQYIDNRYDRNSWPLLRPGMVHPTTRPAPDYSVLGAGYALTVGDIAFYAVGQIVNRRFNTLLNVNYLQPEPSQPMPCPSAAKELAAACKREWSRATPKTVERSLIRDVIHPDLLYRDAGAVRRLRYWFPAQLERAVLTRLNAKPLKTDAISDPDNQDRLVHPERISATEFRVLLAMLSDVKSKAIDELVYSKLRKLVKLRTPDKFDCEMALGCISRLLAMEKRRFQRICLVACSMGNSHQTYDFRFAAVRRFLSGK